MATHPPDDVRSTPQPDPAPPDVDDVVVRLLDAALVDRMIEDLRTFRQVNTLVAVAAAKQEDQTAADGSPTARTPSGEERKVIPYMVVGPDKRETLANLANRVFDKRRRHAKGIAQWLREWEVRGLGRALGGDGPRRGDLFSYMYFDQDFIQASIEQGKRDAEARVSGLPRNKLPWQIE